jgi:hypothetical protein
VGAGSQLVAHLAEAAYPGADGVRSKVFQAVCSPIRNPIDRSLQLANRFAGSRAGQLIGWALARSAGVRDPDLRWRVSYGPAFDNALATLELTGRRADLSVARPELADGVTPVPTPSFAARLTD